MDKMSLFEKISRVREEFYANSVKKTGENKFSGFKYFELSDILPVAIPILAKYKVAPIVSFLEKTAEMTVFDGDSETTIKISTPLVEVKLKGCSDIQNLGAEQTYLRRYLWLAFLEVAENDEIDKFSGKNDIKEKVNNSSRQECLEKPEQKESPETIMRKRINQKIKVLGISQETTERLLNENFNLSIDSFKSMNLASLNELYKLLDGVVL